MVTGETQEIKKKETLVRFSIISYKTRLIGLDCICCWTISTNWDHCAVWECDFWKRNTFFNVDHILSLTVRAKTFLPALLFRCAATAEGLMYFWSRIWLLSLPYWNNSIFTPTVFMWKLWCILKLHLNLRSSKVHGPIEIQKVLTLFWALKKPRYRRTAL